MKTILCYGDSLTWGFDAATGQRTPFEKRWPNVMQAQPAAVSASSKRR